MAMNSSPNPALRAVVRRRSLSRLPTGRAMPKRSPAPERSGMVTTIQLPARLVPGVSSTRDDVERRELRAIGVVGRVEMPVLADGERNLAAVAAGVGEDGGEQVRQVDLGVDLLHDLAVALHPHVQLIAGERGLPRHRLRCRRWPRLGLPGSRGAGRSGLHGHCRRGRRRGGCDGTCGEARRSGERRSRQARQGPTMGVAAVRLAPRPLMRHARRSACCFAASAFF